MTLFKKIVDDWKTALKTKSDTKDVLGSLKADMQQAAKNKQVAELTDNEVTNVLVKAREIFLESRGFAEQAGRADLIKSAEFNIEVVNTYLPKLMSDDELKERAIEAIEEAKATSVKDLSRVMKILSPKIKGAADGSKAMTQVKELLERTSQE